MMCYENLLKLQALDQKQNSEYVLTLKTYLEQNLNATQTANELFIHRSKMCIRDRLTKIWLMLLEHRTSFSLNENALNPKTSARLKAILSFIHENFEKKISLDDIANSVHLCKSECCRFFKKHMQESLFDYLLRYRIEQSIPYLRNPEFSITETALCCGFSDAGYYSRMFKRYTGMSPRDYRIGLFPDYDR